MKTQRQNLVYDDVCYDYPQCGGITINRGRKWWTITKYSNYQGNSTDRIYQSLIHPGDTPASVAQEFAARLSDDEYVIRHRGIIVH